MSAPGDETIKKQVGRVGATTPRERLDRLWQLYLFWQSTPSSRAPQAPPPHVRKIVRRAAADHLKSKKRDESGAADHVWIK